MPTGGAGQAALFAGLMLAMAPFSGACAAIDPVRCAKDKAALQSIDSQIATLSTQRTLPQYSGPAATLYVAKMRQLQAEANATAADERAACTGETPPVKPPAGPTVDALGPYIANGDKDAGPGSAGLTIALAGDANALYAVSLNAGVWKSTSGGPWARLPNSPRYAHSIAIDPNNALHLAVGERGGDASDHHRDHAGLWESFDAGATWSYTFDPLTQNHCTSEAVPSVAFSKASTLVFATTCGVGSKAAGAASVDFSGNPPVRGNPNGVRVITAVAASETKVWARSATELLIPQADGSWKAKSIPASFAPASDGHDTFALAAFDNAAYFPCCDDHTLPPAECGVLDDLVIYRTATDRFAILPNLDGKRRPLLGCSGAGLGGSRFVKTFVSPDPSGSKSPGPKRRLFFSSAEEIYEAGDLDTDGWTATWTRPLGATCSGCTNQDPVHSDFWDFLLSPDGAQQWIANDGGVYRRSIKPKGSWLLQDAGLYTHHAHTLTLTEAGGTVRLVYPTSDNDAWFGTGSGWANESSLGDVNWSAGDAGNPNLALAVRRSGPCVGQSCAILTGFGHTLPGGHALERAQTTDDGSRDGPEAFNFIQSLPSETPAKFALDAIMLATLPLQYADGSGLHNVPGALGTMTGPVLLRNADFAAHPDIDASKGKGWEILANNLPAGASRFWVAGGHASPIVYLMTSGSGDPRLFKAFHVPLEGSGAPTSWTELNVQGSVLAKTPFPASGILDGSQTFGPVFVNPYNSAEVYVLTAAGVMVSETGGLSFSPDLALTNLITGNGKYPLTGAFSGGDSSTVKMASRAVAMGTLVDVSFSRDNPKVAVAGSPFTGVFVKDETGVWHNLSGVLPRPGSSVSDVRIDANSVFVSMEGGGIVEITNYGALLIASPPGPAQPKGSPGP